MIRLLLLATLLTPPLPGSSVTFASSPHLGWQCHQNSPECSWEYLAIADRFPQYAGARRWSDADVDDFMFGVRAGFVETDPQPTPEHALRARIRAALDSDWVMDRLGLLGGPPSPITVHPRPTDHDPLAGWDHIWIADPVVQGLQAIVLRPDGPGPHPAVLLAHGHNADAHTAIGDMLGLELRDRGFVVIAPTFRVNGGSTEEDYTTRRLLADGIPLIALRVYEQALGLRVLRAMPDVDPKRIGLLAHSGGNAGATLLVRLLPWVSAFVTDNGCRYYSEGTSVDDPNPEVLDDTHPALYPFHESLLALDELPFPALRVDYDPRANAAAVLDFLSKTLGAPGAPEPKPRQ